MKTWAISWLFTATAFAHPLDDFMEDFAAEWVRGSPTTATSAAYFEGEEQARLDGLLTPVTQAYDLERVALAQRGLAALRAIDATDAPEATQRAARMLAWKLDDRLKSAAFADYSLPLTAYNGPQRRTVAWLTSSHPIRHLTDAKNYVSRVSQFGGLIDDTTAEMVRKQALGHILPDFIIRSTIKQMQGFIAAAPAENLFATSLNLRLAKVDEVSAPTRAQLVAEVVTHLEDSLYPSYRRAIAMLEAQLPFANSDAGWWRFEGGDRAYADRLRHYTNSDMTAREVHELGLAEVARIEKAMDEILREYGLTNGDVESRYHQLETRLQPAGPDPRPQLLQEYADMVAEAETLARPLFDHLPRARVVVQREPLFSEANAAAHYSVPAVDGSRPGIFWVPMPGPHHRIISRRSLTYHEAIPGHHFQLALAQETDELPRWWKYRVFGGNSANTEGWALYAEWLAHHEGWYEGDRIGELGFLSSELKRARRLVVDTGIHAFKWTRQQVIDYGISPSEADRYIVWPGQACSYKVGQIRLVKLRRDAEKRLGEKFHLPAFHNILLRGVGAPLDLVSEDVNSWIEATLAN